MGVVHNTIDVRVDVDDDDDDGDAMCVTIALRCPFMDNLCAHISHSIVLNACLITDSYYAIEVNTSLSINMIYILISNPFICILSYHIP
jgi:hypothetical protein